MGRVVEGSDMTCADKDERLDCDSTRTSLRNELGEGEQE